MNICQDVGYEFYLEVSKNDKKGEEKARVECNNKFDDITSDLFLEGKYFCNFTKCNPPISKEVLPPLDYRDSVDNT